MTIVHILTGAPASGKSTHARTLDGMRFCLDDMRAMLGITPETWTRDQEDVAIRMMLDGMKSAILAGFNVIADNTQLVPRIPRMYRKELGPLGVEFVVHDFTDVPLDECIRRDAARENPVGEDVIRRLNDNMIRARKNGWRLTAKWLASEVGPEPIPYVPLANTPKAILCDIDGTVALHGDERGHYEYEKVGGDVPNHPVIEVIKRLSAFYDVIFMSGREDRCRQQTEDWLDKFLPVRREGLYMRTTGDHRPDWIIKGELFNAHVRHRYDIQCVYDDRDAVVAMWRKLGLTCMQVAAGNF